MILLFTACIVSGAQGECKLLTDCPVALNEFTKLKKMPSICDKKYRTICCPIELTSKILSPSTPTTTQAPQRISEKSEMIFDTSNYLLSVTECLCRTRMS